jgi:hypothetical protein
MVCVQSVNHSVMHIRVLLLARWIYNYSVMSTYFVSSPAGQDTANQGIPVCADSRIAKINDRPGTKVLVFQSNIVYSLLSYTMVIDDNSSKNKYA